MTLAQFFGCSMIAFGPSFSMFLFTIANDPVRTIMLVASAFFWVVALLFSSTLYMAVTPLKEYLAFGAIFSVCFQELFRYFWFIVIKHAEAGLKKVSEGNLEIVENKHILAYVSGLGFGIISGLFSLVNVLADMTGPGTMGLKGDPHMFFIASTLISAAFIFLHIFWGVIFFDALHKQKYFRICFVVLTHLAATCLTLLNPLYAVSLPLLWILTILCGALAFKVAGGSVMSIKAAFAQQAQVVHVPQMSQSAVAS